MSAIRLKRLVRDHEAVCAAFAEHPLIRIAEAQGDPPERYRIVYLVKGLYWEEAEKCPIESGRHEVEIYLPQTYPRDKPQCTILTPIFHPNFSCNQSPNIICTSDFWAAGNQLTDLILQIGEMIQYQSYNVKSPLNAQAARWVLYNEKYLPTDSRNLYRAEQEKQEDENG